MIIDGLFCPACRAKVLDNGANCWRCGKQHSSEITAIQALHHEEKMRNVELLRSGQVTMSEALAALPKVPPA